jgi:hypothetical protein
MKFDRKRALWAFCAAPAIAAMVVTGAGAASAHTSSPGLKPFTPANTSYFGLHCNPWQLEKWNLNGDNQVVAVFQSSLQSSRDTFTYNVHFRQNGSCLTGHLTDTYWPGTLEGPIYGTVHRNRVTFSFNYPANSSQGTRTFTGHIDRYGGVSGTWSETGPEQGGINPTWTLASNVNRACSFYRWYWWSRGGCPVHSWH